jgi:hypothetical protein
MIRTLIVIVIEPILNCNIAMKYASYQVTASFPESVLNGDMSMIYRQEQGTALQDVHIRLGFYLTAAHGGQIRAQPVG